MSRTICVTTSTAGDDWESLVQARGLARGQRVSVLLESGNN